MVDEIMHVNQNEFHLRVWTPTVKGIYNMVGRSVEWQGPNPSQGSDRWHRGNHSDCARLTHRLLMGRRHELYQELVIHMYRTLLYPINLVSVSVILRLSE